jgi:acyl-CoA synthetase (AMP-forming)/AMP-acid ligase II
VSEAFVSDAALDADSTWGLVAKRADLSGDQLFIKDEWGRETTFGQFASWAIDVAERLYSWGIEPGTRVAWQLPSWSETLVLMAALCRLDAIQVPLLPVYRLREVSHIAKTTSPMYFIGTYEWRGIQFRDLITDVIRESHLDLRCVWLDEKHVVPWGGQGLGSEPLPSFDQDPNRLRWIYHTSGTSSFPKGVCHSERSVLASSRGWVLAGGITANDVTSLVFPIAHIGGANLLQASLLVGCSMVVVEHFDETSIEFMAESRVTLPGAGQAFFLKYLEIEKDRPGGPLFPHVRAFPTGGAPKNPGIHYELKKELGAGLLPSYGMTECPIISTCDPLESDEKVATTDGKPNLGIQIRIVDEDGQEVTGGAAGQITVKGAQLFMGYVQEELESEAFDTDGYFRTGDLGSLDDQGFLSVVGRLKDIIIRKGENISAKEVEDLLFEHPAVRDVAVIGLEDPSVGERACAVIVLQPGYVEVPIEALKEHLNASGLMAQKLPELWVASDALPRNDQGKPLKAQLRKRYEGLIDR